ncbi:glycyl radical protein [Chloroflexota bacterium]
MVTTAKDLRKNVLPKTSRDVVTKYTQGRKEEEGRSAIRPGVKLCLERARLVTESYKETEGEPWTIRRAKALSKILNNMTIYIEDGQLLVGNFASSPDHVAWYPDIYTEWLEDSWHDVHKDVLDEAGKAELNELHKYWRDGRSCHRRLMAALPKDVKRFAYFQNASQWGWHMHQAVVLGLERPFKFGFSGLIKQVEDQIKALEADNSIHAADYVERREFLQSMIIALQANIDFAARYSKLAREMAAEAKDPSEKSRLEMIAEVCDWVPANPPRSLHEALQFHWFAHLISMIIETTGAGSGIRFDVVYNPYYQNDLAEDRITREDAIQLMEMMFLKMEGAGFLPAPLEGGLQTGESLFQTINIGGMDAYGKDITNDMTHIVLDAAAELQTRQPTLVLRYHDGTPTELLEHATDVIRTGIGYPALFNDKVAIPYLMNRGIPLEDARNWVVRACVAWGIPGKNTQPDQGTVGHIVLPKCLELALNQGIDKFTGKQLGYPTPDPETFDSLEDVMQAYLKQVNFFMDKLSRISQVVQYIYDKYYPRPYASAFIDGCIERGQGCSSWREYPYLFALPLGPTNVADALAAIKKLVYDDKKVTLKEIIAACNANWEGYEELRQLCVKSPKYGNDDDYADFIAYDVHFRTNEELKKFKDYYGAPIDADGSAAASNYPLSTGTGATPDGRKDREPFADAVLSPVGGRDVNGPTSTLKSASKIDMPSTYCHLFNQKFQPQFLAGDYKKMFVDYLRTWGDLGVYHIQFNVVDKDTLVDAQKHPDNHPNLIVRVAGYSAYFVDLSSGMQNDIIKRTDQSLC